MYEKALCHLIDVSHKTSVWNRAQTFWTVCTHKHVLHSFFPYHISSDSPDDCNLHGILTSRPEN